MQSIVRGHSSIVGEGCDTGFIIRKISEQPEPTRFYIITKVRRQAIPANRAILVEMKEEQYGNGWARLEKITLDMLPPTIQAKEIYPLFKIPDGRGNFNHSSEWIKRKMAFRNGEFCRLGIEELLHQKVIVGTEPQNYELNQKRASQCNQDYLQRLR